MRFKVRHRAVLSPCSCGFGVGIYILRKRGELDGLDDLKAFADKLEKATIQTIEDGIMTGDLYLLSKLENKKKVGTEEFLRAVNERLEAMM